MPSWRGNLTRRCGGSGKLPIAAAAAAVVMLVFCFGCDPVRRATMATAPAATTRAAGGAEERGVGGRGAVRAGSDGGVAAAAAAAERRAKLDHELREVDALRDGAKTDFEVVEARARQLLRRYDQPGERAQIYAELAHVEAQGGFDHPLKVIAYAGEALACGTAAAAGGPAAAGFDPALDPAARTIDPAAAAAAPTIDPERRILLYLYWGQALVYADAEGGSGGIVAARPEALEKFLQGYAQSVEYEKRLRNDPLPAPPPPRPNLGTVDQRALTFTDVARGDREHAIERVNDLQEAFAGNTASLYADPPVDREALARLASKYLPDQDDAARFMRAVDDQWREAAAAAAATRKTGPPAARAARAATGPSPR